jgi:hypothetical protein
MSMLAITMVLMTFVSLYLDEIIHHGKERLCLTSFLAIKMFMTVDTLYGVSC